jgi:hypothetical protein
MRKVNFDHERWRRIDMQVDPFSATQHDSLVTEIETGVRLKTPFNVFLSKRGRTCLLDRQVLAKCE